MQARFTTALLQAAQEAYLHTALETCGHAPWEHLEPVLRYVDLLQYDLKHIDPARHTELTGVSNSLIIDNLGKVLAVKAPEEVIVRFPVVPGCTDDVENIRQMARLVARLGCVQVELVAYHRLGVSKYAQYGMDYPLGDLQPPSDALMAELKRVVEDQGLVEMTGRI